MFADKIFERATIRGIADYLLFGMGPNQDNRSYEEKKIFYIVIGALYGTYAANGSISGRTDGNHS